MLRAKRTKKTQGLKIQKTDGFTQSIEELRWFHFKRAAVRIQDVKISERGLPAGESTLLLLIRVLPSRAVPRSIYCLIQDPSQDFCVTGSSQYYKKLLKKLYFSSPTFLSIDEFDHLIFFITFLYLLI